MKPSSETILEMRGITKDFPGVRALEDVHFEVKKGEIHALVGENGAGKSTLIKILGGALPMTAGDIFLKGRQVEIPNPRTAQDLGIGIIYQELVLAPSLNAAENIFLGRFPRLTRGLFVDRQKLNQMAEEVLSWLGVQLDLKVPLSHLTVAQQQMVEIAKALSLNSEILVMDEPSAVLTPRELKKLFEVITGLAAKGVAIIYISHRLEEIFQLAHRVTVLKDGRVQGTRKVAEVTRQELIRMMVGRDISELFQKARTSETRSGKREQRVVLEVRNLSREPKIHNVSFKLYQGEILGIAGLVGAGRTEMARALFGADPRNQGTLIIDGKIAEIRSPEDAVKWRLGFVPEDRQAHGLLAELSMGDNIAITNFKRMVKRGLISRWLERKIVCQLIEKLNIRTSGYRQRVKNLSGGNQQKVILARWLHSNARIFIFDEPTRGIDVSTKAQIHQLMRDLVQDGASIIMISSELPEILSLSHRILVMHDGRITGELSREQATEEKIMELAVR